MSIGPWYKRLFRLPWDALRAAYSDIRRQHFDAPRTPGPTVLVDASILDLESALGEQGYAPNWELSHYSRGEVLNLAQVVYHIPTYLPERSPASERHWWQTHIRGYRVGDASPFGTLALDAHWELEPSENDQLHLDGVGNDEIVGTANLLLALRRAGYVDGRDFQYATWDRTDGYKIRSQAPYDAKMEPATVNTALVEEE